MDQFLPHTHTHTHTHGLQPHKARFAAITQLVFLALLLCLPGFGQAADATNFNPVPVQIKATGAGLPVGTVITWPVGSNPADAASWLDCDGQAITQTAYPELYAIVGGNVPDYRGLFLRGVGGKAAAIGVKQNQSVYIDPNAATISVGGKIVEVASTPMVEGNGDVTVHHTEKVFSVAHVTSSQRFSQDSPNLMVTDYLGAGNMTQQVPVKITVSGANETRPDNKAVRYLIRAKP